MSDKDTAKPLFAYAPVGPRFEIKDISNCIAEGGIPYPTAHARVKIYAKPAKGDGLTLIHVREAGRATQPNIYEFSDAGAAIVLSALQDAGISDHHIMREAHWALYAWSQRAEERDLKYIAPGQAHKPRHPIDRAIYGVSRGESWAFMMEIWRDKQTGDRVAICDLIQNGDPVIGRHEITPTMQHQVTVQVNLDALLVPVIRRLSKERQ
ncbi:hypothetical protein ACFXP9_06180 [Paracoccus sp. p1-h21]|uniref:hypothetical protein n=1 Tax=Paracoccus sp. p1-h21 TaxID=3366951 RepID=UPI00378E6FFD